MILRQIASSLLSLSPRQLVYSILVLLIVISFILQRLFRRKKSENISIEEDLSQYEKDESGLYPWESDTDDSPDRIKKDAKPYDTSKTKIRRGSWR